MNITNNRRIEVVDADTNNRRRISDVDDTETSTNYYLEYDNNNMNFMDHHHRQQHHQHQEEKGDDDENNNDDGLIHLPLHNFEPTTDTTNNYRRRHHHHHYHQRRRAHSSHHHHRKLQEITGIATQYVNVYIGTPAQKRTLAISTGADFAAFPCQVNILYTSYTQSLCVLHIIISLVDIYEYSENITY